MAFRRRRNGRRSFRGRRRFRRRFNRRNVHRRRRVVPHIEFKCVDVVLTITVSNIGGFTLLNGAAQGITDAQRIGATQWSRSLQYQLVIARQAASNQEVDRIMLAVLFDKDPDNAVPATINFLDVAAATSPRRLQNRDRWVILKKKTFTLSATKQSIVFNLYKKFNLKTVYSGVAGDITAVRSGALWLFLITDTSVSPPLATGIARCRYTDA